MARKGTYPTLFVFLLCIRLFIDEYTQGVGRFMAYYYPFLARCLGYKASYFNLVFVCNHASVHLWGSLRFRQVGRVPAAGNLLQCGGLTDALQFYLDYRWILEAPTTDYKRQSEFIVSSFMDA